MKGWQHQPHNSSACDLWPVALIGHHQLRLVLWAHSPEGRRLAHLLQVSNVSVMRRPWHRRRNLKVKWANKYSTVCLHMVPENERRGARTKKKSEWMKSQTHSQRVRSDSSCFKDNRGEHLGWPQSINNTLGMSLLSLSKLTCHLKQPFHPPLLSLLIHCVSFTSSAVCLALSVRIPPGKFGFFSLQGPTDTGVFAWTSHFLFGVYIRSLVLVPSTHQTLSKRCSWWERRDRSGDTVKAYKWGNYFKIISVKGGGRAWKKNQDDMWGQRIGKIWLMTRTKWKENE